MSRVLKKIACLAMDTDISGKVREYTEEVGVFG